MRKKSSCLNFSVCAWKICQDSPTFAMWISFIFPKLTELDVTRCPKRSTRFSWDEDNKSVHAEAKAPKIRSHDESHQEQAPKIGSQEDHQEQAPEKGSEDEIHEEQASEMGSEDDSHEEQASEMGSEDDNHKRRLQISGA
ncbi:uncharacterized protein LOC116145690 [Pistacia vera]|uniref:uncharacterized protein LOC116145690 n=1 Tax=Pistacia vera TaxID=55513 RepID=UPI00126336FE|nr:uncharacterized protein LOC116145690 [Pistacia vera]